MVVCRDGVHLLKLTHCILTALPSYFLPSCMAAAADQQGAMQGDEVVLRSMNLVLGYLRLTLACVSLHTGVLQQMATSLFAHAAFNELLDAYLHGREEVEPLLRLYIYILMRTVLLFIAYLICIQVLTACDDDRLIFRGNSSRS